MRWRSGLILLENLRRSPRLPSRLRKEQSLNFSLISAALNVFSILGASTSGEDLNPIEPCSVKLWPALTWLFSVQEINKWVTSYKVQNSQNDVCSVAHAWCGCDARNVWREVWRDRRPTRTALALGFIVPGRSDVVRTTTSTPQL